MGFTSERDALLAANAHLAAEIERLRAALKQVAAEADGGRLSANDDELRDWLMAIRDVARTALQGILGEGSREG